MPTIEQNISTWTRYRWRQQGDEWSRLWGGTDYEWWGTIFPRVQEFLPAASALEIAPGYGRWTRYLVHLCDRLIGIDLASNCIEACRERFAAHRHATFHLNDGISLEAVPDGSIDFAFSFDSLVHADQDVVECYVHELAKKLKSDGVAFMHHSNMGKYRDQQTGRLSVPNIGWRGNMSAELFERFCGEAGVSCIGQEMVNWATEHLNDCFSLLTRPGSRFERPNRVRENRAFMEEAASLERIASLYGSQGFPGGEVPAPSERAAQLFGDRPRGV